MTAVHRPRGRAQDVFETWRPAREGSRHQDQRRRRRRHQPPPPCSPRRYLRGPSQRGGRASPTGLKRGIEKAVAAATASIAKQARSDSKTRSPRSRPSPRDPAIGEVLADAIDKVGKDGTVHRRRVEHLRIELELTEGMQFDKGYSRPTSSPTRAPGSGLEEPLSSSTIRRSVQSTTSSVLEKVMQTGKTLLSSPRTSRARPSPPSW